VNLPKKLISKSDFEHGDELISKMVLLIKQELHHFQQVWEIMQSSGNLNLTPRFLLALALSLCARFKYIFGRG
jgi:tRNA isopentenyl-2-thiomethyl-A-37 hydroxylase MiaE